MFRRLKTETIKNEVHKRIYGQESQGNEITKFLIQACVQAKKTPIEGFILHTNTIQTQFKESNSPHQVQRQYICSAYSCLTSIIMTT